VRHIDGYGSHTFSFWNKDGAMRFFPRTPGNSDAFYEPNSFGGAVQTAAYREPPLRISGDADRYNHREGNDDFSQPRALFKLLGAAQQKRLGQNIAASMHDVPAAIIGRQLALFDQVDKAYGQSVRDGLRQAGIAYKENIAA
jgi:catalase